MRLFKSLVLTAVLIVLVSLGVYFLVGFFNSFTSSNGPSGREYLIIVVLGGAFGGLLRSFFDREGRFILSEVFMQSSVGIEVGSLYEILSGIGASLGVFFVLAGTSPVTGKDLSSMLRLFAITLIAGVGGKTLLQMIRGRFEQMILKLTEDFEKKITKTTEQTKERIDYASEIAVGNAHMNQGELHMALTHFEGVAEKEPTLPQAYLGQAAALKRIALKDFKDDQSKRWEYLDKAIEKASEAIRRSPQCGPAYYNRACYKCLRELDIQEILLDLKRSIEIDKKYKTMATVDPDFGRIRDHELFRQSVS